MSLIGKYNEHDLNFTANQKQKHSEVGDQIIFLGGSGSFTFQVDEGVTNQVRSGISFKMPEGQTFKSITFNENAGATGNILFAVASGSVVDARSVISGETPVLNSAAPNDSLNVNLLSTDAGLTSLKASETSHLKSPLNDLSGATYAAVQNANSVIVSAGSNTDGIILHNAFAFGDTDQNCYIFMDTPSPDSLLLGWSSATGGDKRIYASIPAPMLLPSGLAFSAVCGTSSSVRCWYTVL